MDDVVLSMEFARLISEAEAAGYERGQREMRDRCAVLAAGYANGQFAENTWAEGFTFARRMISQNIRDLFIKDSARI